MKKRVSLSGSADDLAIALRISEGDEVVLIRDGRPVGVLRGFTSADDWLDYELEHDPAFVADVAEAREQIRSGRTLPIDELFSLVDAEEAAAADKRVG